MGDESSTADGMPTVAKPVRAAAIVRAGVMLVAPKPAGIPYTDTSEVRLVRLLEGNPALECIEEKERSHLVQSLAQTFARALYHRGRFDEIVASLVERSQTGLGWMAYDTLGPVALFEAAGVLGAVRVAIDELIFLIGRRHGHRAATIDSKWKAVDIFSEADFDKSALDVEEVRVLRDRRDWQDRVNVYRNMLHHRGWREGLGAYFPRDATHPEASDPSINVMLVPDRESLRGTTRPHKWTYSERGRLEDLVAESIDGLRDVVLAIATKCWNAALPTPGKWDDLPTTELPSMAVSLPIPAVAFVRNRPVVPLFSTKSSAEAWLEQANLDAPHHVTSIAPSAILTQEPHFVLALPGAMRAGMRTVHVEIDGGARTAEQNPEENWIECAVEHTKSPGREVLLLPARLVVTQELFVLRCVL